MHSLQKLVLDFLVFILTVITIQFNFYWREFATSIIKYSKLSSSEVLKQMGKQTIIKEEVKDIIIYLVFKAMKSDYK